jgi:hypothetical protein
MTETWCQIRQQNKKDNVLKKKWKKRWIVLAGERLTVYPEQNNVPAARGKPLDIANCVNIIYDPQLHIGVILVNTILYIKIEPHELESEWYQQLYAVHNSNKPETSTTSLTVSNIKVPSLNSTKPTLNSSRFKINLPFRSVPRQNLPITIQREDFPATTPARDRSVTAPDDLRVPIGNESSNSFPTCTQSASPAANNQGRVHIIKEILSTEKYYVHTMEVLLKKYKFPMIKLELANSEEISVIFYNLDEIAEANRTFRDRLDQRVETWDNETSMLSDIFSEFIPHFQLYAAYGKNYDNAMILLAKLFKVPAFSEALHALDDSTDLKPRFSDLLITPLQRLPRYKLLISDLLRNTSRSHPDYEGLQNVLEQIGNSNVELNDEIRIGNNNRKFLAGKGKHAAELLSDRNLVHEAILHCAERKAKFRIYLFDDILVHVPEHFAQKTKLVNSKYHWPLELVWFSRLDHDSSGCCFSIIGPEQLNYSFRTASKEECDTWLSYLDKTIREYLQDFKLRETPKYQSDFDFQQISTTSTFRYGSFSFPKSGTYTGWWKTGSREGMGSFSFLNYNYIGLWKNDVKVCFFRFKTGFPFILLTLTLF